MTVVHLYWANLSYILFIVRNKSGMILAIFFLHSTYAPDHWHKTRRKKQTWGLESKNLSFVHVTLIYMENHMHRQTTLYASWPKIMPYSKSCRWETGGHLLTASHMIKNFLQHRETKWHLLMFASYHNHSK